MDMRLSSWSLEPIAERDPSHANSKGRNREGFLKEVACAWNGQEVAR